MVCTPTYPILISTNTSIQDTHGRTLCCNQRHAIFHIPQRETHILWLARMLSLYRMPFSICPPPHLTIPFRSVPSSLRSMACPCPYLPAPTLTCFLGPQEQTPSQISQFKVMFLAPGFLAYIGVLITVALSIIIYFAPKSVFPPLPLPSPISHPYKVW